MCTRSRTLRRHCVGAGKRPVKLGRVELTRKWRLETADAVAGGAATFTPAACHNPRPTGELSLKLAEGGGYFCYEAIELLQVPGRQEGGNKEFIHTGGLEATELILYLRYAAR